MPGLMSATAQCCGGFRRCRFGWGGRGGGRDSGSCLRKGLLRQFQRAGQTQTKHSQRRGPADLAFWGNRG